MSEPSIPPGGRPLQTGGGLSTEAILTTHRILGAFGRDPRTFDILHADLFDSRQEVVLSALRALGGTKDARSFMYVARLFRHPDPEIVGAAVKAAGAIAPPDALPVFFKLATSTRVESVLLELLRAMARCCADAPEVRQLATALSRSVAAQAETRAAAIEILVRLEAGPGPMPGPAPLRGTLPGPQNTSGGDPGQGGSAVQGAVTVRGTGGVQGAAPGPDTEWARGLLNEDKVVLAYLFQSARKDEILGHAVLEAFSTTHQELPLPLRASLVPIAAPLATESARAVFFASLQDPSDSLRRECYRYVGAFSTQLPYADILCARLLSNVESTPALEEEAMEAIDTLDAAIRAAGQPVPLPSLDGHLTALANLFRELRLSFVTDIDTTQETGMRIASAKEYLEFHFDEPTKKDFLQSIKTGGSAAQRRHCAQVLKDSGVKLEARHFDGYKVLSALLADPTRAGIALFIRHLARADTKKRVIFCRVMRALGLMRLAPTPASTDLLFSILDWAWKMKLYQLAERALFALHRVDSGTSLAVCREWMSPPVVTRRLAIAAIELLKDMDIASMEPRIIALLKETDRYIRLSLLDALATVKAVPGENLQRAILRIFCEESDQEVASKVLDLLGSKGDLGMAAALVEVYGTTNLHPQSRMEKRRSVEAGVGASRVSPSASHDPAEDHPLLPCPRVPGGG